MTTIVTRETGATSLARPLTNAEVDTNFINLNNAKYEAGNAAIFSSVQLNGGTGAQGTLTWDANEETVNLVQDGVSIPIGQSVQIHCRNNTAQPIAAGVPVMATGTIGNSGRITIAPMDGTNATNAKYLIGLTAEAIAAGTDGKVTSFGKITGLNTTAYADGTVLYVSTVSPGNLTSTVPVAGLKMPVAFVIHSHASGTLMVRITPIDENSLGSVTALPAKIPFLNSDGSTDDILLDGNGAATDLQGIASISLVPTHTININGMYGWRDLFAPIDPRAGSSGPSWTLFRNGIYLYAFPSNSNKEVFASFHLDHDYAMGTKLYLHLHCSVNTTTSGNIRFGFEYTVAKGHQQATGSIFGATTTVYVQYAVTAADQYRHIVLEVSDADAVPATLLEPDAVVLVRMFRDTAVAGNLVENVFGIQMDAHYQCDKFATKNKAPNFNV